MAKKKYERLYRAKPKDSVIGGVCAGIAEHFDTDPVLIRLIAVLALILSFGGALIAYILMWIIIPRK